jgi:hypothetical protein
MGELIKPTKVHVITKDGECQLNITIDLNINLNTGGLQITATKNDEPKQVEEDKTVWAIPKFSSGDKVRFGKNKEE